MGDEMNGTNFAQMVDAVLAYKGAPRGKLFEYPYRDDESRDIIQAAENLVRLVLSLNGAAKAPRE